MDGAERYLLRQTIAAALDYPSVYMGGPSDASVRRAIRIINALDDEWTITPNSRAAEDAVRVRGWRQSPWDSLERI